MTRRAPASETREERVSRLRRQVVLADARLQTHRARCATCGGLRGVYEGLCVFGVGLQRDLQAARRAVAVSKAALTVL